VPRDPKELFDLTSRVAIITGGTRGIGRAIADGFAAAGASIVVASRKVEACRATAQAITDAGGTAIGVPTHMGDLDAVTSLVNTTIAHFGRIDIVVNNAVNGLSMPIEELSEDAWEKSFSVNLRGPVFLAQAALPHLRRSDHAAVLNVISIGALGWAPWTSMYAGAKAALLAFTRNMAAEWAADRIRVNALAPGTVDTDMTRALGPDAMARMAELSVSKRVAAPEEMVGPALFLVSDAASYVTGQVVIADGGYISAR
jgi:NAD(P)-dependent dehydrogenase (short-subunit alcohol dehydrogenase family)